jgi:hypothetical protein
MARVFIFHATVSSVSVNSNKKKGLIVDFPQGSCLAITHDGFTRMSLANVDWDWGIKTFFSIKRN